MVRLSAPSSASEATSCSARAFAFTSSKASSAVVRPSRRSAVATWTSRGSSPEAVAAVMRKRGTAAAPVARRSTVARIFSAPSPRVSSSRLASCRASSLRPNRRAAAWFPHSTRSSARRRSGVGTARRRSRSFIGTSPHRPSPLAPTCSDDAYRLLSGPCPPTGRGRPCPGPGGGGPDGSGLSPKVAPDRPRGTGPVEPSLFPSHLSWRARLRRTRESPTRRVTRSRSKYSARGMA